MKKSIFYWLPVILGLAIVMGCAQPRPKLPSWEFAREAIHVRADAASQLNLHEGKPHTLMVCFYQLKNMTTFPSLTDEMQGRYKLLECEPFDATVASAKRLILQPGDDFTLLLDRQSGARHLAVIAGYYLLEKKRIIRTADFSVNQNTAAIEELNLEITFGAQQIERWEKR